MIKVLFASSEAAPFAKMGGLGDVVGSLPLEFDREQIDARVILPKYKAISKEFVEQMRFLTHFDIQLGWRNQYCGIFELDYKGIKIYFIDNEYYFAGNELYSYIHEDVEKFAFFSKAALSCLPHLDFKPDIIHCNDWQTGAIPVLLHAQYADQPFYRDIKTIMTIHNLRFQGIWDKKAVQDVLGLPQEYFSPDKLEFGGDMNLLKGGLVYADVITTVSNTYAQEIKTSESGEGLDGLLRARQEQLHGIMNGISYEDYNPPKDAFIYQTYNRRDFVKGKRFNKASLQKDLGLAVDENAFLVAVVSRLTSQKGIDLIAFAMEELTHIQGLQLVVLGTGEDRYEGMLRWYGETQPDKIHAAICFDNALAHKIYAAGDMLLMPSLFEPCGLSQMIAMRYGTLPLVRETGGLRDSVLPYNEYENTGNGFSFGNYHVYDMMKVLRYAKDVYDNHKAQWQALQRRAMAADFSWKRSAQEYAALYRLLMPREEE